MGCLWNSWYQVLNAVRVVKKPSHLRHFTKIHSARAVFIHTVLSVAVLMLEHITISTKNDTTLKHENYERRILNE